MVDRLRRQLRESEEGRLVDQQAAVAASEISAGGASVRSLSGYTLVSGGSGLGQPSVPQLPIGSASSAHESSLCEEALSMLRSMPEVQIWWPKGSKRQFTGPNPDSLDLYSGIGGVARNLLKNGCPFVVTYVLL